MKLLEDVRVLDLTQLYPGEYATLALADLGANVLKVERPGVGDIVRLREPTYKGDSRDHAIRNRAKDSLSLDLKSEDGREIFLDLAAEADVIVESFRPGVVDRLGIGYDDVSDVNEEIVYCSLSGFGQDGPRADDAGYDLTFLAMTGMLSTMGHDANEPPVPPGFPMVDVGSALTAAFSIVSALFARDRAGEGHYLDVSMAEVAANWGQLFPETFFDDSPPSRGEQHYGNHPGNTVYEAADGEHLAVCAFDRTWAEFCRAIGREDLVDAGPAVESERFGPIREEIATAIADRPRAEWLERFADRGVAAEPVVDLDEIPLNEQFTSREFVQTVTYPDGDEVPYYRLPLLVDDRVATDRTHAPRLGEDTDDVLEAAGYEREEIDDLVARGIVERRSRDDERVAGCDD